MGSAWSACRDLSRLGTGPLPDATGAERKEGQGATGTLQALHGPAAPVESDGRDGGPRRSPHSPRGRAGPGAHVLRPPREPCGLVGQSWGQPRAPPGERGGGTLPGLLSQGGRPGPSPNIEVSPEPHAVPGVPARAPTPPLPPVPRLRPVAVPTHSFPGGKAASSRKAPSWDLAARGIPRKADAVRGRQEPPSLARWREPRHDAGRP